MPRPNEADLIIKLYGAVAQCRPTIEAVLEQRTKQRAHEHELDVLKGLLAELDEAARLMSQYATPSRRPAPPLAMVRP